MGAEPPLTIENPPTSSEAKSHNMSKINQVDGNVSFNSSMSYSEKGSDNLTYEIPVIVSDRKYPRLKERPAQCLKRIQRNNKLLEAVQLPIVLNLNPRSLYNKAEEFRLLIEQTNCNLCFISESFVSQDSDIFDFL